MQKIPGYTLLRELGRGGMATVYLARHDFLQHQVALKIMQPPPAGAQEFAARFLKEGRILFRLQEQHSCPQIIRLYDLNVFQGIHYISMEYLPNGTLTERIQRGLSPERTLEILRAIAQALAVAHGQGIIHRDIKPQNILFREDETPVLTDFGIARIQDAGLETTQLTQVGMVIGSPRYMSPEQTQGQPVDARADLYSLGVLFYEMLTQELPYQAKDVVSLAVKHCTAPIPVLEGALHPYQPMLEKLLAKKPEDRFDSAQALIQAIDRMKSDRSAELGEPTRILVRKPEIDRSDRETSDSEQTRFFEDLAAEKVPVPAERETAEETGSEQAADTESAGKKKPPARSRRRLALAAAVAAALGWAGFLLYPRLIPQLQTTKETPEHPPNTEEQTAELIQEASNTPSEPPRSIRETPSIDLAAEADRLEAQARQRFDAGDLSGCSVLIQQGLAMLPNHAGLLALQAELQQREIQRRRAQAEIAFHQAQANYDRGQFSAALEQVQQGLALQPNHPQLQVLQAKIQQQLREREQIQAVLTQARAHLAVREEVQALQVLEAARQQFSEDPELEALREEILAAQAQRTEKIRSLIAAATQALQAGELEKALRSVRAGLELDALRPDLQQLHREILRRQAQQAAITQQLTACGTESADLAAQVRCYRQVLLRDPQNEIALNQLETLQKQLFAQIEAQLHKGAVAAATPLLASAEQLYEKDPRLPILRKRLEKLSQLLPEMIALKGGCFQMGSPETDPHHEEDERLHQVCIKPFRLAKREVRVADFQRFVAAEDYQTDAEYGTGGVQGCWAFDPEKHEKPWDYHPWANWKQPNKARKNQPQDPVSCVSKNDAERYIRWLNQETGQHFRLPTEAEWEYAARGGTQTPCFWGECRQKAACDYANTADAGQDWEAGVPCDDGFEWVAPVGSFSPNPLGFQDLIGNLLEWTCSAYDPEYSGLENRCMAPHAPEPAVLRGGAWNSGPTAIRTAYRNRNYPESRYSFVGFRLAQDE